MKTEIIKNHIMSPSLCIEIIMSGQCESLAVRSLFPFLLRQL